MTQSAIDPCSLPVTLGALVLSAFSLMSDTDKSMNFEKKLNDLEALVAKLETGELSLEESLKAYEAGIALTTECQSMLEKAQLRIELATSEVTKAEPSPEES